MTDPQSQTDAETETETELTITPKRRYLSHITTLALDRRDLSAFDIARRTVVDGWDEFGGPIDDVKFTMQRPSDDDPEDAVLRVSLRFDADMDEETQGYRLRFMDEMLEARYGLDVLRDAGGDALVILGERADDADGEDDDEEQEIVTDGGTDVVTTPGEIPDEWAERSVTLVYESPTQGEVEITGRLRERGDVPGRILSADVDYWIFDTGRVEVVAPYSSAVGEFTRVELADPTSDKTIVTDGGVPVPGETETVTTDHVVAEFGTLESGLAPVHESEFRADFRYVNDARSATMSHTALLLPDYFDNGDNAVRFTDRLFSYSWPHTYRGEERGDEWRNRSVGPSLTARLSPEGVITEWSDGSVCRFAGLTWTDAARVRFARSVGLRFPSDEIAGDAFDYADALRRHRGTTVPPRTADEPEQERDERLVTDGGVEQPPKYDPADEYDEIEERSGVRAFGDGRRAFLDAADEKGTLDDIQTFETLREMTNAVRELSLAYRDGTTYRGIPTDAVDALTRVYENLPDEAQAAFLNDDTLHRRINAARKAYNRWLARKRREQEMPSWVEAGPANYPADKSQRLSENARDAGDDLDERIDKIRAGANGARQRALESVGSSVAEQNEREREQTREERRDEYEKGDIVRFRNPNVHVGRIHRVNQKSVRIYYPNPRRGGTKPLSDEPEPDISKATIDLDSDHLYRIDKHHLVDEDLAADDENVNDLRDDLIETGLLPEAEPDS